ncbi:hypothetical protein PYW08_014845 [Mythimna loreyi]|uniref:Uncharacterized protein n=1 Tax=Mythimna loreyi TaxID=667449 RepID=A0ACC2R332_9NEOP|nr:hypothetical protein PYW08_014845 [Mythimna loreyi]
MCDGGCVGCTVGRAARERWRNGGATSSLGAFSEFPAQPWRRQRHAPPAASHRSSRYAAASPLCRTTRPLGASRGPRARPASLLLLAAWLAAVAAELACPQDPPAAQIACASCRSYENAREHSLRVIRESLLAKLGFTQAPNTTGRELPTVPADMMERFERRKPPAGVQADAPAPSRTFVTHTEQDDFLARTDNVLIFAR